MFKEQKPLVCHWRSRFGWPKHLIIPAARALPSDGAEEGGVDKGEGERTCREEDAYHSTGVVPGK